MDRYAAKLLFQFRVVSGRRVNRRRVCEERIVLLRAGSPKAALTMAKGRGRGEQTSYEDQGRRVFFEFVGVLDLLLLGTESEPDEVWWEFVERIRPMERRRHLIPAERSLSALREVSPRVPGRRRVP
jgi:hypothetical protein